MRSLSVFRGLFTTKDSPSGHEIGIIYGQKKKARRSVMINGLLYGK